MRSMITMTARIRLGATALAIVLVACGGSSSPPHGTSRPSSGTGEPTAEPAGSLAGGDPARVSLRLEPVVDGLDAPLFATGAGDGSGRLFVLEQAGRIRIVDGGRLVDRPFLDIVDRVASGGERGLLGLAFAPGYGSAGENCFYVDYTDRDGNTVVAEFRAAADATAADPSSERALLHVDQPYPNHNGGMLAFGPDGMLYVGLGDGGSGGDPLGNGQRLDTLLAKILRIDPRHASGTSAYAIPSDNPFVDRTDARPEIWAYGLRNPWRFSFDRGSHDLWIGDVGQGAWEEIDRARAGAGGGIDYGWNRMEGRHCYAPSSDCDQSGLTLPIAEYGHDQGCSVTGGYVARGPSAGPLGGVYLFGDYCSGRVWGLDAAGPDDQNPTLLIDGGRRISSFGEDDAGDLFATDIGSGTLVRVVATGR